jgi:hypothetical protein
MKSYRHIAVIALLTLTMAIPGSTAESNRDQGRVISQPDTATSGVHDFDSLVGQWRVHHRKLKERLANNHENSKAR